MNTYCLSCKNDTKNIDSKVIKTKNLWISLEKGECFDFSHSLGCIYPILYIIRLLRRVYHFSLLICYPSSIEK